jgi:hypothetical protein
MLMLSFAKGLGNWKLANDNIFSLPHVIPSLILISISSTTAPLDEHLNQFSKHTKTGNCVLNVSLFIFSVVSWMDS